MKKIYIVLTHTGTVLSKIIRKYTKDEFSHVSIALDNELKEMYSFGRLHPYNPFWAGFVHEYINRGTFKRFYKTMAKIYVLNVTDEQYDKIKNIIKNIETQRKAYKFNIIGLFAVGFHIRIKMKKAFYCAEFVKYVMEKSGMHTNLPEIIRPENFKEISGLKQIYAGPLRKYHAQMKRYHVKKINVVKTLGSKLLTNRKEGII